MKAARKPTSTVIVLSIGFCMTMSECVSGVLVLILGWMRFGKRAMLSEDQ